MAKKKNITEDQIIDFYMDYVLTHEEVPKSVYAFAKHNNFEESKFYAFYGSFEALEASILETFFNLTIEVLHKSDDYDSFSPQDKLLSFYFTFFEMLTANRSFVVHLLQGSKKEMLRRKNLSSLKKRFTNYIVKLGIKTVDLNQEQLDKLQHRGLKESAWFQLLVTLKFWLDDDSPGFEKTDIFIEKSIKASFDFIDTTPLKSIIDFGKFLFKEKVHNN